MKSIYLLLVALMLSFSLISRDKEKIGKDSLKKEIRHGINVEAFGSSALYSIGYSLFLNKKEWYRFSFSTNFSFGFYQTLPFINFKFDHYFGKKSRNIILEHLYYSLLIGQ